MPIDPRTPVIVGVAQRTHHHESLPGPEPLQVWEEVSRAAARDAGIAAASLSGIDFLAVALPLSWNYDDPVSRLAERLGSTPRERYLSAPSGTAGHVMLHRAAAAIRDDGAELAVICGGEALASLRHYRQHNETPPWSHAAKADKAVDLDKRRLPAEAAAGLTQGVGAVYGFAMRDVARRAHLGISPADYIAQLGALEAGMTRVAAANPDAWFRIARTPEFLVTPRADNRIIAYPYTKHMTAIIDVDIAAALVVTSEAMADRLGIARARRVYPWGGCFAQDPVYTAVRPDLWQSAAMRAASQALLAAANVTMDDVRHVDLYSCFPAAVNFARDALGIGDRPGDRITVTGGLPYAGGPASSYVVTSLARMTHVLRGDPGSKGLVSGLGKQMAHHAFGLYSTTPPGTLRTIDESAVQAKLDRIPEIPVVDSYAGRGTVAAYTVIHDRAGAATHGAAICDLPDGSRAYAMISDPALLAEAEQTELVGRCFDIKPDANGGILGSLCPLRTGSAAGTARSS